MIIKDKFVLLKDVPNILNIGKSTMNGLSNVEEVKNLVRIIRLIESRLNHFTKNKVLDIVSNIDKAVNEVNIVNLPQYTLPISFNKSTKSIVLNLDSFGVSEISRIDPRTVYGALAYGVCMRELALEKTKIKDIYFSPISNFLATLFVRAFGKEFGLMGAYATELPKLKFLISCYILSSFFGITGVSSYRKAGSHAVFDFKPELQTLNKYDFTNIEDFIKSLSEMKAMPGITKHSFTAKMLRFYSLNFLPALEDISRFIASMTVINISGSGILPSFLYTYNVTEYNKILKMSQIIFR